ncbi:Adhesion G protein-coupled receptor L3 [Saguinus oedipus]|uniref:Adhesion G protein-coupled receptor L3 n=1 Tax=Saguinus oedipus TaxID=9490 RepID=A0ABQ9W329_SAGOE|nr:Adhesion G protein-coupled receptor L3 [Saguinus oedipus]
MVSLEKDREWFEEGNCSESPFLRDQTEEDRKELAMLCLKQKLELIIDEKIAESIKKLTEDLDISTTGPLGMGSTTTSTTLRTTTLGPARSTTPSVSGRRNRSTSTPSPAVEVLDDMTTHFPSASSQIPALEESCEAVEAREIMWFKTRQGQIAKQPCPAGTIGKSALKH